MHEFHADRALFSKKMVSVSSFVPALLSKLPNFTFHEPQRHSSVHGLLSHTRACCMISDRLPGFIPRKWAHFQDCILMLHTGCSSECLLTYGTTVYQRLDERKTTHFLYSSCDDLMHDLSTLVSVASIYYGANTEKRIGAGKEAASREMNVNQPIKATTTVCH
jgi:hypothetical protein